METGVDLRRGRASIAAISVALGVLVTSGLAHAQSAEAEALFNDGNRMMEQGKLREACEAFEASNRVEARAGALIRLGECREQNRQLASAWSAYRDALIRVKDPRKREFAMARAAALEPRLSYLTVLISGEDRIEGLTITRNGKLFDAALWNRALPLDGGDYVIEASAPGHQPWQFTASLPIESGKIAVAVPRLKERVVPKVSTAPPAPSVAPEPAGGDDRDTTRTPTAWTLRRRIALGAAGTSAIGIIAGLVLGESARGKEKDAFKLCPDPATPCEQADRANALIKQGHSRALEANVAFGLAGAAAIAATVLWFTGSPESGAPRRVRVVATMAAGHSGLLLVGRF